jgi:hypothetical protein
VAALLGGGQRYWMVVEPATLLGDDRGWVNHSKFRTKALKYEDVPR